MFESLFGAEMPLPVKFFISFVFVLALIGLVAWIVRRFGSGGLDAATGRGRQPRLAVIDAATVDGRRRLILIRRDNVEHLLMIGGPTDLVIEASIVRTAAAATREPTAAPRTPATADTLPRAVPLGDAGMWPLQPEPAPVARPQRAPAPEESAQWPAEPELPPPPSPRRQPRGVDPLAGIAAEVARLPELPRGSLPGDPAGLSGLMPREPARPREVVREREAVREREPAREREPIREREPAREREAAREREVVRERETPIEREPMREREPVREREQVREPVREPVREREPVRMREPQVAPVPAEPEFNASADQNLADMAQRLEAALRRPAKTGEARPAPDMDAPAPPRPAAPPAEPKPAKSLYDSLEKEMASLLGRPSGKS